MAEGGTVVPPLPKRPTVIKSSVRNGEDGPVVPARPAPPVPPGGRPPPPIPGRPNYSSTSKPPGSPTPQARQDVPRSRPHPPATHPARPPEKPPPTQTTARKRPEITIVSARPMSEVGFRGGASAPKKEKPLEQEPLIDFDIPDNNSSAPEIKPPSANRPSVSPGINRPPPPIPGQGPNRPLSHVPSHGASRPPPPVPTNRPQGGPPPIPHRPSQNEDNLIDFNSEIPEDISLPPPMEPPPPLPARLTPPLTFDTSKIISNLENGEIPDAQMPPSAAPAKPKRPTVIRPAQPAVGMEQPEPPPRPQSPGPSASARRSVSSIQSEVKAKKPPKPSPRMERKEQGSLLLMQKEDDPQVTESSSVPKETVLKSESAFVPRTAPKLSSIEDKIAPASKPNKEDTVVSRPSAKPDSDEEEPKHRPISAFEMARQLAEANASAEKAPPSISSKPKPNVLPKPKPSAKPTVLPKTTSPQNEQAGPVKVKESSPSPEVEGSVEGKSVPDKIPSFKRPTIIRPSKPENKSSANSEMGQAVDDSVVEERLSKEKEQIQDDRTEPVKLPSFKKPTIIRPPKPQTSTVQNKYSERRDLPPQNSAGQELVSSSHSEENVSKSSSDVNTVIKKNESPVPSKRATSMVSIPSVFAKESALDSQEPQSRIKFSKTMDDIAMRPKPQPRGSRPVTMAVPERTRPPPSSAPHSPGPPVKPPRENLNRSPPQPHKPPRSQSSDPSTTPTSSRSVSQDKHNIETVSDDKNTFVKPVSRPPPVKRSSLSKGTDSPKASKRSSELRPPPPRPSGRPSPKGQQVTQKNSEDSDSDEGSYDTPPEEMPEAKPQHRPPPPRPVGRPSKEKEETMKKEPLGSNDNGKEKETVKERPPRPGGLPPPATKSPQTQADEETAQDSKPGRPKSGPPRPASMSLKSKPARPSQASPGKAGCPSLPERPGPGHPLYHYMLSGPRGKALFDYTAAQQDELSFRAGDYIMLTKRLDADWLVGKLNDKEGMFPSNFLEIIELLPGEVQEKRMISSDSDSDLAETWTTTPEKPDWVKQGPRCRARFDYDGEGQEDLAFEDGDVVKMLERVGEEWIKGEINGKIGIFPLAFVEIIEDLPLGLGDGAQGSGAGEGVQGIEIPAAIDDRLVTAMYDFDGEFNELTFKTGDKIMVLAKVDESWLHGEIRGHAGSFPASFVDRVPPDLPDYKGSSETSTSRSHGHSVEDVQDSSQINKEPESYCVATYDFQGESEGDLAFHIGDHIQILERVDQDWIKGRLNGQEGIFPAVFVEIV